MSIKGLIFDFDGLILDTETPDYQVWQEIYQSYGASLPLEEWQATLGTSIAEFDPVAFLSKKIGQGLDRDMIWDRHDHLFEARMPLQPAQPGIPEILEQAHKLGLHIGIASSSPESWVHSNLEHLGLKHHFEKIICRDHVKKIKPDPELFLRCAQELGLSIDEAIIFEDSPNGILAANRAGIYCVAVPNLLTRQLNVSHANLVLDQIDQVPLEKLCQKASMK
jgi:HAD superfamily hydrolase (TIGR01509 family)